MEYVLKAAESTRVVSEFHLYTHQSLWVQVNMLKSTVLIWSQRLENKPIGQPHFIGCEIRQITQHKFHFLVCKGNSNIHYKLQLTQKDTTVIILRKN